MIRSPEKTGFDSRSKNHGPAVFKGFGCLRVSRDAGVQGFRCLECGAPRTNTPKSIYFSPVRQTG